MPKPLTPNIQKSERAATGTVTQQPPPRIINTPPAAGTNVTLAQALADSRKNVDAAK
jgi:hypothetical protein